MPKEYIEREAAKKVLADDYAYAAAKLLDTVPAEDVQEVRHGKWETPTKPFPYYHWKCSICGCEEYSQVDRNGKYREMNYCPNCGAKMDKE